MTDLVTLEARLQADANVILDRNVSSRRYVVFDIEYAYDREGQYRADRHATNPGGTTSPEKKFEVKWPFHRIACISATALAASATGIAVEAFETWSKPEMTEAEIVRALADLIDRSGNAVPTTWGGEYKDLPAILAVAMREGFALPSSLANGFWPVSYTHLTLPTIYSV